MKREVILILDFGSQVTQLIARRIRETHVYCEIYPHDITDQWLQNYQTQHTIKGIVLSGGPQSVYADEALSTTTAIFDLNVPILGICYGMQWLMKQLGGTVAPATHREFGHATIRLESPSLLFSGIATEIGQTMDVWMSHGDHVTTIAPEFRVLVSTASCPIAGVVHEPRQIYGIQFHPEVTHTVNGHRMIKNFVQLICQAAPSWTMKNYIDQVIEQIKTQVGDDEVILGLSGGVDSSVAAALIAKAIGPQLTCVFVDHGLLRLNEANEVMQTFAQNLGVNVIHINARDQFFTALAGETDPERKRKIIGREFVEVFQAEAQKRTRAQWLAQGTIYPDVIESAGAKSNKAHKIKSHHNVGGLPETLALSLLEPLRELFKDEVRQLGIELGLPPHMVYRHPFPGPGLAVRILGEIKPEFVDLLQRADAIFIEELQNTIDPKTGQSWYALTSQAFVVFLPVKTVGVMGDGRSYDYAVALRAVETTDFMTAHWAHLPYDLLGKVSNRIINEVRGINRVTYDISGKPPATIEWE